MHPDQHPLQSAFAVLLRVLDVLLGVALLAELWLRHALEGAGLSPGMQNVVLIALAVVLAMLVLRAAGGVLRLLLVVVVVLVVARAAGVLV